MGGKGYRHKKGCKCRLCKRGGENTTNDIEMGNPENDATSSPEYKDLEMGPSSEADVNEPTTSEDTYDKLEKGEITSYQDNSADNKVGGTRRRRRKNTSRKSRKTLRRKRISSRRRGKKHSRKH